MINAIIENISMLEALLPVPFYMSLVIIICGILILNIKSDNSKNIQSMGSKERIVTSIILIVLVIFTASNGISSYFIIKKATLNGNIITKYGYEIIKNDSDSLTSEQLKYFDKNSNFTFLEYRFFGIRYKQIPKNYKLFVDEFIQKDKEVKESISKKYN